MGVKVRFNRTIAKTSWARRLRQNAPEAEARLWYYLRNRHLGVDFRRHHPAGRYVLDFYCPALRLAIEVDGGQHASTRVAKRDQMRTRWLAERGVTVVRVWNSDVFQNIEGVVEAIIDRIRALRLSGVTPTRRWRADLPLSGGGDAVDRSAR